MDEEFERFAAGEEEDTAESPVDEQSYQELRKDMEAFNVRLAEKETTECDITEEDVAFTGEINAEGKQRKTADFLLDGKYQENQYAHKFCVTYVKPTKERDRCKEGCRGMNDVLKIPEVGKSKRIDIQLGTKTEYADIWKFCAALFNNYPAFGYTVDPHWYRAAFSMLLACMTHFLYVCEQKGRKYITTTDLYLEIASHSGDPFWDYLGDISRYEHSDKEIWFDTEGHLTKTHPVVSLNAKLMLSKPDKELGSIYSTLIHLLEMYFDPSECIYEMQRRAEYIVPAKEKAVQDEDVKSYLSEPLSVADSPDPVGYVAGSDKIKNIRRFGKGIKRSPRKIVGLLIVVMLLLFIGLNIFEKPQRKTDLPKKCVAAAVKEADDNIPVEFKRAVSESCESIENLIEELNDTRNALAKERSRNDELVRILTKKLDQQQTRVEVFGVPLILTTKTQTRDAQRKNK